MRATGPVMVNPRMDTLTARTREDVRFLEYELKLARKRLEICRTLADLAPGEFVGYPGSDMETYKIQGIINIAGPWYFNVVYNARDDGYVIVRNENPREE
jgi:hypothetical protein